MGDAGHPHARFRRALATGNALLACTAAAELPQLELGDALELCLLVGAREPERFGRFAARWLARYALETPGVDLREAEFVLALLRELTGTGGSLGGGAGIAARAGTSAASRASVAAQALAEHFRTRRLHRLEQAMRRAIPAVAERDGSAGAAQEHRHA